MNDPKTVRLLIWVAIIAVLFFFLKGRLAGIASGLGSAVGGGFGGGGGGSTGAGTGAGTFDTTPGTITAPGVTPTPVAATGAAIGKDGNPQGYSVNIYGKTYTGIEGTNYVGVAGSKLSDVHIGSYGGSLGANIPGSPGLTQGVQVPDWQRYSDFHANDSAVLLQIEREKGQVAPGQKAMVGGYRADGTPVLIYGNK